MVERGTIRKVGQYYRNTPEYREEILRGLVEFFGANVVDDDNPLFNEWMLYDFRFSDGKGMLEKFYSENPLSIPLYRREIYNMLTENYYGLYEVLEVVKFAGLSLKRLSDGKVFEVHEMSATMNLEKEDVVVLRVAKVIDHYELVGADAQAMKLSESRDFKEKEFYLKTVFPKVKMDTPKDAFLFFKSIQNDKML